MAEKEKFYDVIDGLYQTYEKKNLDYGDSFRLGLEEFGSISYVTRVYDKMLRMKQLVRNDANVTDESFADTVADMANYCIMYLMWQARSAPK